MKRRAFIGAIAAFLAKPFLPKPPAVPNVVTYYTHEIWSCYEESLGPLITKEAMQQDIYGLFESYYPGLSRYDLDDE